MRKLFYLLLALPLLCAAVSCETSNEIETKPTISLTTGDVVEIEAEGGEAVVSFTTENGSGSKVTAKTNASWLETKVEGNTIKLTAEANNTADVREAVVALTYEGAEANITVKQAASKYDVVFKAKRFEGIYFGNEYSDTPNYYIILSDIGVKTDASLKANGTYYIFDMYRNIVADELNPVLPDGDYKFDTTNSYADKTFSDESSWYAVTGADSKPAKSASFNEATVTE